MVCLAAFGAVYIARDLVKTRDHLQQATLLTQRLRQQTMRGDLQAVTETLALLSRETAGARSDTGGTWWRLGLRSPVVGDDLQAVRTVTVALDDFVREGLPPLVAAAKQFAPRTSKPQRAPFDLSRLQAATSNLSKSHVAVRRGHERVAAIPTASLTTRVRTAVVELAADLDRATTLIGTAMRMATLLLTLLGADGPRTMLVLFQNPAEVRATGGMPGVFVVIRADRGTLDVIDQGTASADLATFDHPVLALDPSLEALYSERMGIYPADVNLSPHFPTAAKLAREMYRRRSGRTVDGVLATDPIALSYLLTALGPVRVPGGPELTAKNAVAVLLSDTYARPGPLSQQDEYFLAAATATFEALMSRPLEPADLLDPLARAARERRILFWSADPVVQQAVSGTVLGGVLPASDGAQPTVGVFLNDGSGAKLGYYLTQSAKVTVGSGCRADGRRGLKLRIVLGSTAPKSGLPPYVLGLGLAGDPYTLRTIVAVYGSTGGVMDGVLLDGEPVSFGSGRDRRRPVGVVAVDVKPGTKRTLDVDLLTGVPRTGGDTTITPRLWMTPGVRPWTQSVQSADGCPTTR